MPLLERMQIYSFGIALLASEACTSFLFVASLTDAVSKTDLLISRSNLTRRDFVSALAIMEKHNNKNAVECPFMFESPNYVTYFRHLLAL